MPVQIKWRNKSFYFPTFNFAFKKVVKSDSTDPKSVWKKITEDLLLNKHCQVSKSGGLSIEIGCSFLGKFCLGGLKKKLNFLICRAVRFAYRSKLSVNSSSNMYIFKWLKWNFNMWNCDFLLLTGDLPTNSTQWIGYAICHFVLKK